MKKTYVAIAVIVILIIAAVTVAGFTQEERLTSVHTVKQFDNGHLEISGEVTDEYVGFNITWYVTGLLYGYEYSALPIAGEGGPVLIGSEHATGDWELTYMFRYYEDTAKMKYDWRGPFGHIWSKNWVTIVKTDYSEISIRVMEPNHDYLLQIGYEPMGGTMVKTRPIYLFKTEEGDCYFRYETTAESIISFIIPSSYERTGFDIDLSSHLSSQHRSNLERAGLIFYGV